MRSLPDKPVFTRADARAAGWSDPAFTRAVRAGRILRVRHNRFAAAASLDPVLAARAAALDCAGSVISHESAALFHGLPLLNPPPRRPRLTVQPEQTGDVAGALLHRAAFLAEDVTIVDGAPVLNAARTVVDLARTLPIAASVVTADAALHAGLVTAEQLRAVLARCSLWPGVRRAVRAIALADAAAESPLESVSRLVIVHRLALPVPHPQAIVRDEYGVVVGRCDFYWDEFGVFGEADGRSKYDDRDVLTDEKTRHEELEDLGLEGVRWRWRDVRSDQARLRRRILNAFERGRRRDASSFPRRWSVDAPESERQRGEPRRNRADPGKT
jgi:hypothetical protein